MPPNDSQPVINDQEFSTNENSAVGTVVGSVLASDADAGQSLTYSIVGGSGATVFQIDAATGELTVADTAQLDRETIGTLTVHETVESKAGYSWTTFPVQGWREAGGRRREFLVQQDATNFRPG